jgi:phosphate transport system regulatory protein PhoU
MQRHFDQDLAHLKQTLLRMGGLVESQIQQALQALVDRDSDLAVDVIKQDHDVNALDVEIDELCIQLLALQQPTARDLRFVTTGMKISSELERMGDLADNIAQRSPGAERRAAAEALYRHPTHGQLDDAHGQGLSGRLREFRSGAGAEGVRRRRLCR